MSEWSIVELSKSFVLKGTRGSNPRLSARDLVIVRKEECPLFFVLIFYVCYNLFVIGE